MFRSSAMTHQSHHQTNGASLEDCHTNFYALVSNILSSSASLALSSSREEKKVHQKGQLCGIMSMEYGISV